ncbi:hypothetical protein [Nocardia asiatica]|nr:hypothetical protein [Nocardia asiatica]
MTLRETDCARAVSANLQLVPVGQKPRLGEIIRALIELGDINRVAAT